jgi:two-component system sensor histidine kinase/response regulator
MTKTDTTASDPFSALAEAEAALELTQTGYWSAKSNRPGVLMLSARSLELLGFAPEMGPEISVDAHCMPRLAGVNSDATVAAVRLFLLAGEPLTTSAQIDFRFRRALDDEVIWVRAVAKSPHPGPAGPVHLYGAFQDITAQAAIERELTESRERFELGVRGAGDGLWDFNHLNKHTWFSPRFSEILGFEEGELPATFEAWSERFHPEDAPAAFVAFRRHLAVDTPYDMEYRVRHRAGHYLWIRARAKTQRDASGQPYRTSGTVSDLTARKQAELLLEQERRRLQSILDASPICMAFVAAGRILFANPAFVTMFDLEVGCPAPGFLTEWAKSQVGGHQPLPPRGLAQDWEVRNARGQSIRVEITSLALSYDNQDGQLIWIHDVSDRYQVEMALRASRDMAEETARVKSEFLANMSHEIRTPLNAIIGMSHLTLKTELDQRQRDYLQKIQQASHHLLGVIDDVLDFSKIEAGMLKVEAVEFSLDSVLSTLMSIVGDKAAARGLQLEIDIAHDVPPMLVGDALRLGQILVNYVNNAIKFTQEGRVSVAIRVLAHLDKRVELQFSVRDTGIGLSAEQISRLFQSFHQADTSTTRKYGGTGLGLAISKRLAALMQGEVGVSSELGKGAMFWFTAILGVACVPSFSGLRGLIVDANDTARHYLHSALSALGLIIDSVATAAEAWTRLAQAETNNANGWAVLLLADNLPDTTAFELLKRIQALASGQPKHILLMTETAEHSAILQQTSLPPDAWLPRPVNLTLLTSRLLQWFGPERVDALEPSPGNTVALAVSNGLQGARILLVEDHPLNQQVARDLLMDAGLEVVLAQDGVEALERLAASTNEPFDLILMDMQMPRMDGLETARRIRLDPALHKLPIVAMTANAMESDRERCIQAGMVDFLSKPLEPQRLFRCLVRWIEARAPLGHLWPALVEQEKRAEKKPRPGALPPVEPYKLESVYDELERLLVNDDGDAERLVKSQQGLLRASFPDHFPDLYQAACAFDCERALSILRAARESQQGSGTRPTFMPD